MFATQRFRQAARLLQLFIVALSLVAAGAACQRSGQTAGSAETAETAVTIGTGSAATVDAQTALDLGTTGVVSAESAGRLGGVTAESDPSVALTNQTGLAVIANAATPRVAAGDEGSQINLESVAQTPDAAAAPRRPRGTAFSSPDTDFLRLGFTGSLLPSDYQIGPLENDETTGYETRRVLDKATAFLAALERGEYDAELVSAANRDLLQRSLSYPLDAGLSPDAYRLGQVTFTDATHARLNLRLYRGASRCEGEIVLESLEGTWWVSDLLIDLTLLELPYSSPEEPFIPLDFGL